MKFYLGWYCGPDGAPKLGRFVLVLFFFSLTLAPLVACGDVIFLSNHQKEGVNKFCTSNATKSMRWRSRRPFQIQWRAACRSVWMGTRRDA